jgi:two-component system KDP operon response regulator KdpE
MTAERRILIVEDEEQLLRMLRSTLIHAGYEVCAARTGGEALAQFDAGPISVILLDLGLPDMDGKDVIAAVRRVSGAPIIVISARGSEAEKIAALDRGANDYMAKPFDVGELLARIRVALRPQVGGASSVATTAGLEMNFRERKAVVNGQVKRLSAKEAELLRLLSDANGEIVPHQAIIDGIWGPGSDADLMHVRVLTWQARKKIEPDPSMPQFIIAEPGLGYRLQRG